MPRSFLLCLGALLLTAGCRSERTLTDQRRPVPLASAGEISSFVLESPNPGELPANGQCDTLARSVEQLSSVKGQLVSYSAPASGRRITVGVGAQQRILYYNDVHQGEIAEWVLIDRRFDDGMAVSMRRDVAPRRVHGHADEFLLARGLGTPAQVARHVLNACSAMLANER